MRVGNTFPSRRRRRCSGGGDCVAGGRIRPGDRVVRVRQHGYFHEADVAAVTKAIEIARRIDWSFLAIASQAMAEAVNSVRLNFSIIFDPQAYPRPTLETLLAGTEFDGLLDPSTTDSNPVDSHPDRCWRCDAKPGMEELDGACWHCHFELTAPANNR